MSDPPRPEITAAIKKCHNASIKIIMVTGDSSSLAKSIAVKIGLTSVKARVVTGTELDAKCKADLKQALSGEIILSRVAPEQKYKMFSTLQEMGVMLSSTGVGVKVAPACKKADMCVAMGESGTDVAKDAADKFLTDDNLSSIVSAM